MISDLKRRCIGCGACADLCPRQCIEMTADSEGFLYPNVDIEKCICCNLCDRGCPVKNDKRVESFLCKVYGMYARNNVILGESSSGGVFYSLAEYIISNGGVVCGAIIDKNIVKHTIIERIDEIKFLMGSKYVQSDTLGVFNKIKQILNENKKVLFVGTPCQVNALKSFLGNAYTNLFTTDFVCHGVPSPAVWNLYVKHLEKKFNKKIVDVKFRDKTKGWKNSAIKVIFEDGSCYFSPMKEDPYMRGFINNYYLRDCCYSCEFKGQNRLSDITIGDFWGVEQLYPTFFNKNGVSIVIKNTETGYSLIEQIKNKFYYCIIDDFRYAFNCNSAYYHSVKKCKFKNRLIKDLKRKAFDDIISKYDKKNCFYKRLYTFINNTFLYFRKKK